MRYAVGISVDKAVFVSKAFPTFNYIACKKGNLFPIRAFKPNNAVVPVNDTDFNLGVFFRFEIFFDGGFMHRHKVFTALEVFVIKD